MNRNLALRHLCWKEVRQVLPLVWMQLGLGVCFQLLFLLQPDRAFVPRFLVFAGMPSLFALGVGALLVGQEKERRTLDWLRSLPIAAGDLLAVKLATGFFALLVVWGLNLLLLAVFVVPTGRWPMPTPADSWLIDAGWEYLWPLQSVFLLLAGFAVAWVFRSSLVALLALVPLALLPSAVAFGLNYLVKWPSSILSDPAPWMMAVALIVLSPPLLMVGWRRGRKSLAAEQFSAQPFFWNLARGRPWGELEIWERPTYSPAAMLIWQFVRQNRKVLKGIAAMLLVALVLLISDSSAGGRTALAGFLGAAGGVLAGSARFPGRRRAGADSLSGRARCLAREDLVDPPRAGAQPAGRGYVPLRVPLPRGVLRRGLFGVAHPVHRRDRAVQLRGLAGGWAGFPQLDDRRHHRAGSGLGARGLWRFAVHAAGHAVLAAGRVRAVSVAGNVPADAALDGRPPGLGLLERARRVPGRRLGFATGPRGSGSILSADHACGCAAAVAGGGTRVRHDV